MTWIFFVLVCVFAVSNDTVCEVAFYNVICIRHSVFNTAQPDATDGEGE